MTLTYKVNVQVSMLFAYKNYPDSIDLISLARWKSNRWPLTFTYDIRFKVSITFAAKCYPQCNLFWLWTCNLLNTLNRGHIWPLTLTLTSGVKCKVGIAFAAKGYPWCGIFIHIPAIHCLRSKLTFFCHRPWPWLLSSNQRWSSCSQRQTTPGSTTLSYTRQIINITQFWFVRWPWPLGSNSRSLIRCNPWVMKNPHAENRVKILKIGGVVRARTDGRTDGRTDRQTDGQTDTQE